MAGAGRRPRRAAIESPGIKRADKIELLDDTAEATSQMQEFAARTQQDGVPRLAREYQPAIIEQAAMPIRVEKWLVQVRIRYRVVRIAWGGSRPVQGMQIRFNPAEDYRAVEGFRPLQNDPWTFWTHTWSPEAPGRYSIRLACGTTRLFEPGGWTPDTMFAHFNYRKSEW